MDLTSFADIVERMRHAQREFFRTRSQSALEASKKAERAVDAALKELQDDQRPLFER